MNFKNTDIKITVGKETNVLVGGLQGKHFYIKELKSVDGIKDNELIIDILKQTDFSIFGRYGLITNKLTGGMMKVEEMSAPFERYLAKDYFRDSDEFDEEDQQSGLELDYDSFKMFGIVDNDNDVVGFIIIGGETEDEEEFYGLPEFKLTIYPTDYFTDMNKMDIINFLSASVKPQDFLNTEGGY